MSATAPSRRKRTADICIDKGNREAKRRCQTQVSNVTTPSLAKEIRLQPGPRPSDHWPRIELSKTSETVRNILENGNWAFLCGQAVKHHPSPSDSLHCTANLSRVASGFFNAVFELSFSDGTFWVARIRLPDDEEDFEREMLSEIATMRLVSQETSIPIPTVFSYDCKAGNPFGFPYMLTSTLPGRVLRDQFAFSVPPEFQPKLASQMAGCIKQLSKITFPEIGQVWAGLNLDEEPRITPFVLCDEALGPFNSSRAYFYGIQREINEAIFEEHSEDDTWPQWLRYSQLFIEAIPLMLCPRFRRGPFPLHHRDFHFKNILVDDDFNITGVLDWTGARTVPWEQFAIYGDIMPYIGMSEQENKPITDFRNIFVDAYRSLEPSGSVCHPSLSLSCILDSAVPDLIQAWANGMPDSVKLASRASQLLLTRLFGDGTTFENYKARRRMKGAQFVHRRRAFRGGDSGS